MLEVLDGRGLGFLFPLMKLEKELLNQLKKDSSPQGIYKWIRDNISLKLHTDPGFVNILITRYRRWSLSPPPPVVTREATRFAFPDLDHSPALPFL